MEILKDTRNDLLKRQEVSVSLEAEKNPNFDEMKKQISEKFGKSEEVLDVYNIKGSFGSHKFKIDAYIYDSKEGLEKAMPKKKRQGKGKEVKVEESKEETPEETKKEEKIESKPAEDPVEAPVEERPEQEQKAIKEQKQAEEEVKEP